jgi:hypothetical protein
MARGVRGIFLGDHNTALCHHRWMDSIIVVNAPRGLVALQKRLGAIVDGLSCAGH